MDRFASIRIPGSKKERPHLPHVKHSSSSEWSSSSAEFEELSSKITSEQEILGLFEKMMVRCIVLFLYLGIKRLFASRRL
uniref:Uncharacterized protein n=1 Tax=Oncorhynchus kisutch TaxID=8019 RepID=A0A8C7N1I6_ONCKI